jgi:hypothetical protein
MRKNRPNDRTRRTLGTLLDSCVDFIRKSVGEGEIEGVKE